MRAAAGSWSAITAGGDALSEWLVSARFLPFQQAEFVSGGGPYPAIKRRSASISE